MESKQYTPCGGCGAETPIDRCIGCMHPFTKEEEKVYNKLLTPERDLILRIVEQWGNAIEMPNMEQWLKDYAGKAPTGPRWVKGTRNFPVKKPVIAKKFISYLNKEVVGTASSATGEMICFDWGVSSVCLAIGHEELNNLYWLDEQPAAGREEDAVAFLAWIQKNDYYYSTHGGGYWYEWNEKEQETFLCNTNDELYNLFKKENP